MIAPAFLQNFFLALSPPIMYHTKQHFTVESTIRKSAILLDFFVNMSEVIVDGSLTEVQCEIDHLQLVLITS